MKSKFLNICVGISIVLLSIGFLIRSIIPSQAAPMPDLFLQQGTNKIGKYMMVIGFNSSGSARECLVWDTETAKSVYYLYSDTRKWYNAGVVDQLPAKPKE